MHVPLAEGVTFQPLVSVLSVAPQAPTSSAAMAEKTVIPRDLQWLGLG